MNDQRVANRILAALPLDEYRRLAPNLRPVALRYKQVLQRQGEPIRTIYFPDGGVTSMTTVMKNGRMIELATIGKEGMISVSAVLGADISMSQALVQVPDGGAAHAMPADVFAQEIERRGALWDVVTRYSQAFLAMLMQSSACNGLHSVEQRCCRWLLMTHDRLGRDTFQLSQEFLAVMLGVRRATVTRVAGILRSRGLIRYGDRAMRIVNRAELEAVACECYRVVADQFARLLPEWKAETGNQT